MKNTGLELVEDVRSMVVVPDTLNSVEVEVGIGVLEDVAAAGSELFNPQITCVAGLGPPVRGLQPGRPPGSTP